jgi:hypothetical protein
MMAIAWGELSKSSCFAYIADLTANQQFQSARDRTPSSGSCTPLHTGAINFHTPQPSVIRGVTKARMSMRIPSEITKAMAWDPRRLSKARDATERLMVTEMRMTLHNVASR